MAVFFNSGDSEARVEIAEYERFPKIKDENIDSKETLKSREGRHLSLVLVSFGVLCVLQATLNISLRLALKENRCFHNWLRFGSSCYYVSPGRRSWESSRQDCRERGADLVILNSREEQDFVKRLTAAAWVGMTDMEQEGTWRWVDGTLVDMNRLDWAPGQPDGAYGGEDCGEIRAQDDFTGLNDFNCGALNLWICERAVW